MLNLETWVAESSDVILAEQVLSPTGEETMPTDRKRKQILSNKYLPQDQEA